jgi:hypothetical protein
VKAPFRVPDLLDVANTRDVPTLSW